MNKQEMVEALAGKLGSSKAHATEVIDTLFGPEGLIAGELKKGNRVQISGFGNFEARQRAARRGRNPQTGEDIRIKASLVPAFRPGKALKDLVNRRRA